MHTGVSQQNTTGTVKKTTETQRTLHRKTPDNVTTATHGEAFAYVIYVLYAEDARKSGNQELADLFERAANTERFEHLVEEAQLGELVCNDTDTLEDAIKSESYEIDTMYLQFAQRAGAAASDTAAANRFEEISYDEMGHHNAFKAALAKLEC